MGRRAWMLLAVVGVMAMAAVVAVSVLMGGCAKPVETAAGGTVPMKCHWTFVATTLVGTAGVVTALLALAGRTKEGRRFAGIATVAVAAATVLLTTPAGIGLCANPDMSCHQPGLVLWVAAGIALVVGIVQAAKADPKGAELPKMKL